MLIWFRLGPNLILHRFGVPRGLLFSTRRVPIAGVGFRAFGHGTWHISRRKKLLISVFFFFLRLLVSLLINLLKSSV